jgi:hypothetical protein
MGLEKRTPIRKGNLIAHISVGTLNTSFIFNTPKFLLRSESQYTTISTSKRKPWLWKNGFQPIINNHYCSLLSLMQLVQMIWEPMTMINTSFFCEHLHYFSWLIGMTPSSNLISCWGCTNRFWGHRIHAHCKQIFGEPLL